MSSFKPTITQEDKENNTYNKSGAKDKVWEVPSWNYEKDEESKSMKTKVKSTPKIEKEKEIFEKQAFNTHKSFSLFLISESFLKTIPILLPLLMRKNRKFPLNNFSSIILIL